jgi:hypothetical protein
LIHQQRRLASPVVKNWKGARPRLIERPEKG